MIERIVVTALVASALGAAPAGARIETQPPEPAAAALTAPVIAKLRLSNGLQVWIVEQHGLPVVQMTLLVQSGTAADPRGRYGTASLALALLTQGAGARTAVETPTSSIACSPTSRRRATSIPPRCSSTCRLEVWPTRWR